MSRFYSLALILAVVLGVNALVGRWQAGDQGRALREVARPGDILMLSSLTCTPCARARSWMVAHKVPHLECFIENDASCRAEFQARSAPGTPTFVVRGQTVVGFDRVRILKLLEAPT